MHAKKEGRGGGRRSVNQAGPSPSSAVPCLVVECFVLFRDGLTVQVYRKRRPHERRNEIQVLHGS
jgi:hypothetical protein